METSAPRRRAVTTDMIVAERSLATVVRDLALRPGPSGGAPCPACGVACPDRQLTVPLQVEVPRPLMGPAGAAPIWPPVVELRTMAEARRLLRAARRAQRALSLRHERALFGRAGRGAIVCARP